MAKPTPELELVSFYEGEVGEPVEIETPQGTIRATWLGTIGRNGWSLADACKLMAEIAKERETA